MNEKHRILLVEDDQDWLDIYLELLQQEEYILDKARSIQLAFTLLQNNIYEVVVTDLKMLGFGNEFGGFGVLQKTREISPATQVIIITAYGTQDIALRATQQGAFDIVYKPPDPERFRITLRNAIQAHRILARKHTATATTKVTPAVSLVENQPSVNLPGGLFGLMGNSKAMQSTYEKVSYAVHTSMPVLIFGESGTGKSLIAKTIHDNSDRQSRPFAPLTYDDLNRSWQKIVRNIQRFQGGTFFVDGVPENADNFSLLKDLADILSLHQVRLITAATTARKDAMKLQGDWGIADDIYNAIAQVFIYVPPLRHRKDGDDIPALAGSFLRTLSEKMDLEPNIIVSSEAMKLLLQYDYPNANVRELYMVIESGLSLLGEDNILRPEHLLFKGNPAGDVSVAEPIEPHSQTVSKVTTRTVDQKASLQNLAISLETARRALSILEKQAAAYTSLTIPPHLQIELEDKRREVATLESLVAQLPGGKRPE